MHQTLKTITEGSPHALGGVRQRWNLTLFKAIISSNNFIHLALFMVGPHHPSQGQFAIVPALQSLASQGLLL